MDFPISTYRLQLSPQFPFEDLEGILEYLENLGVSTIYSAPFFQAREGSSHGYDVLDPFTINREIGDLKQFRAIRGRNDKQGISWLQDIVPNHMAYDPANPWINDIFELGPSSRFYNFFDINWDYKNWGKVMAPFLGGTLDEILGKKELELKLDEKGFSFNYYENRYPLSARSYKLLVSAEEDANWNKKFDEFSGNSENWEDLKISFLREIQKNGDLKEQISTNIERISKDEEMLGKILDLQFYLLTHWKQTEKEINYRRFFTINGLICLRMEDQNVFETYHYFIKELVENGFINGLRIDHIDGLFDPEGYLQKLRKMFGEDIYLIVEKILEAEEELPKHWPVQGTSGYEFLAQINHLFTRSASEDVFSEEYEKISPKVADYEKLVYRKKLFILKERMGGELQNLWMLLKNDNLLEDNAEDEKSWKDALSTMLAAFPVYRIYPHDFPLKNRQRELIEKAYNKAIQELPEKKEELNYLLNLFTGEAGKDHDKMLYFLQRCQQFSGPLAAKGVEDTSFYIYNRLVAHNEVGDSPDHFGITVKEFHRKMLERNKEFPHSLNATATHDTKRGEDSRMRLSILSEIPQEWFGAVKEWKEINAEIRKKEKVPGANEEYFIYQTLLAGMPFEREKDFLSRTCEYLQKVLREAKEHSNWAEPDEEYEQDVFQFVENILKNEKFRSSFDPFSEKISRLGAIKSLGQVLVKITAPGIPDIYQGTELWDLNYVDPDNRRPVDYALRMSYVSEFKENNDDEVKQYLKSLREDYGSGKVKMLVLQKALQERLAFNWIFEKGEYLPLPVRGENSGKFLCYARIKDDDWRIILVPILTNNLFSEDDLAPLENILKESYISLPENSPKVWESVYSKAIYSAEEKLPVMELLKDLPVAFLKNKK